MNIRNVLVVAAVLTLAASAQARRTGNTYQLATSCTGCHGGGGAVAPTIEVTQVTPDPLVLGGSAIFNVKLTTNNADGAGRFAAFAASVTSDAGVFIAGTEAGHETQACPTGSACPAGKTAIRDVTRRAWDGGTFDWDIELTNLGAGDFTLAVGGNDVNGNGQNGSGDENGIATLAFSIAEGEGEGEGGEGEGEGEGAGEGEGEGAGEGEGEEGEGEPAEGEGEGDGGGGGGCCSLTGTSPSSTAGLVVLLALTARRRRRL